MSTNVEQTIGKSNKTNLPSQRQLKLLDFFSNRKFSEEELQDIQTLIANYYAAKADAEMDALVEEKGWTQEDFDRMGNMHIRTPYDPKRGK